LCGTDGGWEGELCVGVGGAGGGGGGGGEISPYNNVGFVEYCYYHT
jgi:hypothetical protein